MTRTPPESESCDLDHSAATIEVTDDVTDVVFWSEDVELHDGLKNLRAGFGHGLAIGRAGCDFEGHCRGVHRVEATISKVTLKSRQG